MFSIQIRFVSIIYATNSKTYERHRDINFPTEDPRLTMILQAVSLSYSGEKNYDREYYLNSWSGKRPSLIVTLSTRQSNKDYFLYENLKSLWFPQEENFISVLFFVGKTLMLL